MEKIKQFFMPLLLMLIVGLGISLQSEGQTGSAVLTSTPGGGLWPIPPGVSVVTAKVWGAGGGGGNFAGTDGQGGGGGGAFHKVSVGLFQNLYSNVGGVSVGLGGTAGNAGGQSTFASGLIAAAGGSGSNSGNGFGGSGGIQAPFPLGPSGNVVINSSATSSGGNGGASTNPFQTSFGGGGGGRADDGVNGGNGGNGGTSGSGAPGLGGLAGGGIGGNTNAVGGNATSYGGGGGGRGFGGANSGTGGNGRIEITWDCPTIASLTYTSPTVCSYSSALTPTILPATAAFGGTYSSTTLTGFLNTSTGAIAPSAPQGTHTITYGWPAFGGCPAASVSFTLTIAPQAVVSAFSYATPYCSNSGVVTPTFTATGVAGTFTSTAGLSINATTGAINTGLSTPGSYVVTYTVAASGNCNAVTATANVTITALPTVTAFDYPDDNKYCTSEGMQTPTTTYTGPNAGTYSSTAGLTLNATTGAVNPATSTVGVYTVTYTIAASAGCAAVTSTQTVEILALPLATIAYSGSPYCATTANTFVLPTVTPGSPAPVSGTYAYTGTGTLQFNTATGSINLDNDDSDPGTYTVTYTFAGANGCTNTTSTTVVIKARPTSTISYAGPAVVCSNVSPIVSGNVTAVGAWTLTLSNGQTTTGTGSGPWSIAINTMDPGEILSVFSVSALVDANNCPAAGEDRPGSVIISKRTITAGTIDGASNVKVCEGQAASINVVLTSGANCAPTPRFSGVFAIEYWDGAGWVAHPTNPTYAWTNNAGASTTGTNTAISIPASILNNPNSYTLQYRISWVSLVDCNGCAADPLDGVVVVEIVPNPLLSVTAAPVGNVCPGTTVSFTVTQLANSYVLPQFALFNWVATRPNGSIIAQGQNTALGTISFATPACPFNDSVTVRFTPLNTSCCNCLYTPIFRKFAVRDTTAPVWMTAPTALNKTLECSDLTGLAAANLLKPVASDNCDTDVTNIVKTTGLFVSNGAPCTQSGKYTNTWVVTDECGNTSAIYTQVITITDTTKPVLTGTIPAGATLINNCKANAPTPPTAAAIAALFTDNCGTVSATLVTTNTGDDCAWSFTHTYTVKDNCGNTVVASPVIVYSGGDKTAPTIGNNTFPVGSANNNLCYNAVPVGPTEAAIAALYTDNCGGAITVVKTNVKTGDDCAWTIVYSYSIKDKCGNEVLPIPTVTYTGGDKTAPNIITGTFPVGSANNNLCYNAVPVGPTEAAIAALYTDNCGGTITVVKTNVKTGDDCAWTIVYTYSIKDKCGNEVLPKPTVTYTGGDKTAPNLIIAGTFPVGNTVSINGCIGSAPVGPTVAAITALYTDNCGGAITVVKSGAPTGTDCAWTVTYTYSIKDKCGNEILPRPTVTYFGADATAPVFAGIVPTQILNVGAFANCMTTIPDYRGLVSVTDCGAFTLAQLAPNAIGTSVSGWGGYRDIVIEATDACGNKSQTTFRVELKDLTAPNAICKPYTLILNANGTGTITTANINNGSNDNCAGTTLTYSLSQTSFNCSNVGANTVTLSVTDQCQNTSTCTAIVTVVDNTAPVIECFGDTTVNKDANCTYTMPNMTFRVTATDACGIATVTQNIPVGHVFAASQTSTLVTLTVKDVNGNQSTCTFRVNFVDVTPPVITGCPSNITVFTGLGRTTCNQVATWIPPVATDACTPCCQPGTPQQTITGNFAPGATFPVGVTTVTYTATDLSGNTSTCVFTVTVIDNTAPVVAGCPANVSVNTGAGRTTCDQTATWTEPTATDNCTAAGSLVRYRSHAPGATFPVGTTMIKYAFTDAAGNTSDTCRFTVTVVDNTAPIITCPGNIANPPINTAGCLATVTTANPTFSDNCAVTKLTWAITGAGIVPAATSPTTGINYLGSRTFNFGVTTVTYTATDAANNSTSCSYTITVTRPLTASIAGTSTVLQNLNNTSTVSFTARFGTAPYTIVYTTTAGGFPSAGTHTIVTTNANTSTIGGDPNWLVTTVPQSNATPGVYTYTLVSVTDFYGCVVTPGTTAVVTVVDTNYPAPDLTPSIASGSTLLLPSATKTGYLQVFNSPNTPVTNHTSGIVAFEVYNPSNFTLSIAPGTTTIGATTVNNSQFDIVYYAGIGYAIQTKPGVVIPANGSLKVGYTITSIGSVNNQGQFIVNIVNQTGGIVTAVGDNNDGNNNALKTFKIIN